MAKINPIQMQKYLKGVHYPASGEDLIKAADNNDAPDDVKKLFAGMKGKNFEKVTDVSAAIGDMNE
jgi:hypothetical protein